MMKNGKIVDEIELKSIHIYYINEFINTNNKSKKINTYCDLYGRNI